MEFEFSTTHKDPLSPLNPLPPEFVLELEERAFAHYPDQEHRMERARIVEDPFLKDVEPLLYDRRVEETSRIYYAGNPIYFYAHFFCSDFRNRRAVWNHQMLDRVVIVARKAMVTVNKNMVGSIYSPVVTTTLDYIDYLTKYHYPTGTPFVLLAHMQPNSFQLFDTLFSADPRIKAKLGNLQKIVTHIFPEESFTLRERVRNKEGFNSFWFHTQ